MAHGIHTCYIEERRRSPWERWSTKHRKPGSIGVQGAFASNSMHYTSPYTHHQLTTPRPGKRFLGLPLRVRSNIFRSRAKNAGFSDPISRPFVESWIRLGRRISAKGLTICRISNNDEIVLCCCNCIVGFLIDPLLSRISQ